MIHRRRPENREKGVLLPVFSLPSRYGIGCFSREARKFVDWLQDTGNSYWQILPLNPTGMADSPYQPLSSFAGNAYFIDPVQLVDQGLLSQEELDGFNFGDDPHRVDYNTLYGSRMEMLKLAHRRFRMQKPAGLTPSSPEVLKAAATREAAKAAPGKPAGLTTSSSEAVKAAADNAPGAAEAADLLGADEPALEAYRRFVAENASWLEDYALFMALREVFGKEQSWDEWPQPLRLREPRAIDRARQQQAECVDFYRWTQYEFYRQWASLKAYANERGVRIIGDTPVYVSYDSADCWASPDQFQLDEDLKPTMVAGVPPDDFAEEGQLWGNPLYDWEKMREDGYAWWIRRIQQSFVLYDVIRLDHFRGYEAYYSAEADAPNALNGVWRPGPGLEIFQRLETALEGDGLRDHSGRDVPAGETAAKEVPALSRDFTRRFIAEDLGFLTDGVRQLLQDTGFPGMKVIQFAFNGDPGNIYLPENYPENCVTFTGTHDNDTTPGWFRKMNPEERAGILQYLGYSAEDAWWLVLESDAALLRGESLAPPPEGGWETDGPPPLDKMRGCVPDPALLATDGLIAKALDSRAGMAIVPLQDYLHLGTEARINVPGTIVNNWEWRFVE